MELDIRSKLALQLGTLVLTNIELAHQLEGANTAVAQQRARADQLQAKHDAAVDARDVPSGAPAPGDQLP